MAEPRVIVMTGVTRGLGRALTDRFVEAGHTVIGCGRSTELISLVRKRHGRPHRFETLDVADDGQVAAWAKAVIKESGPPDLLINNAATINPNANLWEVSADDFDRVIDVNVKGVANVIRHFVPAMVQRQSGMIVNISSGWGRSTSAEVAPYCATKWAVEGLTRALAQELPRGMAAIPLNPGVINTELLQSCFGHAADHYPDAEEWSESAARRILAFKPSDNGHPLSIG